MIIKFTKDTEVEGRLYLAGQSHDFSRATAEGLIKDGAAWKENSDQTPALPAAEVPSEKENEESSTLTITDLDGNETIVTAVIEPAPVTPKAKRRK